MPRRPVNDNPLVSSTHGQRTNLGFFGKHLGYDYKVINKPVIAPISGKIKVSGWSNALGNIIEIIEDGTGRIHRLAHLSRRDVSVGQHVNEGQQIGISGATGSQLTGPHLHHDVRKAGTTWNASFDNYIDWEALIKPSQAPESSQHRYQSLIGKRIQLSPKNGSWRAYRAGTDEVVGDLMKVPGADGKYVIRGVDNSKPGRVLVNSAALGQGISVPLANSAGQEYSDEWRVII